jgi:hypothetical protein
MAPEAKVSMEQAADALRQLVADHKTAQEPPEAQLTLAEVAPPAEAEPPAIEEPAEPAVEEAASTTEEAAETDDVESLKKRLTERETLIQETEQRYQSRLQAQQQRHQESERILRERHVRKSAAADRALKILEATRTEAGVPEGEVDRAIQEIKGTMNPLSPSYVPPPNQTEAIEDQSIALNTFLNEKQMDIKEADEFGRWIKTDGSAVMHPNEQALAYRDIDGFLRIAHVRYQESLRDKVNQRTSAAEAVKTVQRTQKQAARAASAAPAAPRKTTVSSTPPGTIDYAKITQDDVAALLRKAVDQHR